MASPFPGMDPYLEQEWHSFHNQLIGEIARQLTPQIVPRYLAFTPERVVLDLADSADEEGGVAFPDVAIMRTDASGPSDVATSSSVSPLIMQTVMPEEIPHVCVEIRDAKHRRLVTVIELLSPSNKRGIGRRQYLHRRLRYLRSTAHLLEIDLLRGGQRVPMRERLPPVPYFAMLGRFNRRPTTQVWPIQLTEALPSVPVPLLPGDADVRLDLQAALTTVYDSFGYRYALNYADTPPPPPLAESELAWIRSRVQSNG